MRMDDLRRGIATAVPCLSTVKRGEYYFRDGPITNVLSYDEIIATCEMGWNPWRVGVTDARGQPRGTCFSCRIFNHSPQVGRSITHLG